MRESGKDAHGGAGPGPNTDSRVAPRIHTDHHRHDRDAVEAVVDVLHCRGDSQMEGLGNQLNLTIYITTRARRGQPHQTGVEQHQLRSGTIHRFDRTDSAVTYCSRSFPLFP